MSWNDPYKPSLLLGSFPPSLLIAQQENGYVGMSFFRDPPNKGQPKRGALKKRHAQISYWRKPPKSEERFAPGKSLGSSSCKAVTCRGEGVTCTVRSSADLFGSAYGERPGLKAILVFCRRKHRWEQATWRLSLEEEKRKRVYEVYWWTERERERERERESERERERE